MTSFRRSIQFPILHLALALSGGLAFAAASVDPTDQPLVGWQLASFTLSTTDLSAGAGAKAYRPWFENGSWQGDIIEYNIAGDGTRSAGSWTARAAFTNNESNVTDYWKAADGRKIVSFDGSNQIAFRWDQLTAAQATALDPVSAADNHLTGAYDSPILNYLRGDRSLEQANGGTLRTRYNLLGDIVHSQPVYVGAPTSAYTLPGYATYKNSNLGRAGRLYVGANDGMIHAFDTQNGNEVYAYVPALLTDTLGKLTKASYLHTYYADGQLVAGDAKLGSSWKTLVAGGLGAGTKGLIALDVTNPNLSDETAGSGSNAKVLWEKSGDALGYIHGRPRIAKLPNGNWYVVTGNGYGSVNGVGNLYLASLSGGADIRISTGVSGGLSAPALIDLDHDGDAEYAYAGDINGNLWRFDLTYYTTRKLFAAGTDQPITTAPEITNHPIGGRLIYFGTGSLLSQADAENTDRQSIYAIWDRAGNTATIAANRLQSQTLTEETYTHAGTDTRVRIGTATPVTWSSTNLADTSGHLGWKVDLPATGERLIGNPQLRGQRLQFVTHTPPDGGSWLLGLNWLTGGDLGKVAFDLDNDLDLDAADKVTLDDSSTKAPVGLYLGTANLSQPTIARVAGGTDILYVNGLKLPQAEPCIGVCEGGISGGHIDVDMDTELGGGTDAHKHEYDDSFNLTYVDYFDLMVGNPVDEVGIDGDLQFVVILANADLSPGGIITIGDKEWNVVDYQEMMQRKLTEWIDQKSLLDDDEESLVHTLNEISSSGGTIRISFDDLSILSGGLIGTNTGCVKDNQGFDATGRWRNGALTTHLIDITNLKNGNVANNVWIGQEPIDLAEGMVGGGQIANPANDSGFLYESTLFWHWKGDLAQELIGDGGMCYGEAGWAEAWAAETSGLSAQQIEERFPGYIANATQLNELLNYSCEKGVGKACEKEDGYKELKDMLKPVVPQLDDLIKFWEDFKDYINAGSDGPTDGSTGTGTEASVEDKSQDLSPVLGPNFTLGRRAWIDL